MRELSSSDKRNEEKTPDERCFDDKKHAVRSERERTADIYGCCEAGYASGKLSSFRSE